MRVLHLHIYSVKFNASKIISANEGNTHCCLVYVLLRTGSVENEFFASFKGAVTND